MDELLAFRHCFLHFLPPRKLLIFGGRLYFLECLGYRYYILPLKYRSTGLDRHLGWGRAESLLRSGEPKARFILRMDGNPISIHWWVIRIPMRRATVFSEWFRFYFNMQTDGWWNVLTNSTIGKMLAWDILRW